MLYLLYYLTKVASLSAFSEGPSFVKCGWLVLLLLGLIACVRLGELNSWSKAATCCVLLSSHHSKLVRVVVFLHSLSQLIVLLNLRVVIRSSIWVLPHPKLLIVIK